MLYDSHLYADCIEKFSREICNNAEFQSKCNQKFTDIVYSIKDGFKDTLGFLPTSLWVSQITNFENRQKFLRIVALSIPTEHPEEIFSSIDSKDEFESHLYKKSYQILNDDRLLTKALVDDFLSMEAFLPQYLYENSRLKRFLYGNFSLSI